MAKRDLLFKKFFLVAALYDLLLGIIFLTMYKQVYAYFGIALPNSPMYLLLAAAFVFANGVGYCFVYKNMYRNIDLVKLGVIYKAIYSITAVYFFLTGEAHVIFFIFAILDAIFLLLFVSFLNYAKKDGRYLKWK